MPHSSTHYTISSTILHIIPHILQYSPHNSTHITIFSTILRGGDLGGTAGDGPPKFKVGEAYVPPIFLKTVQAKYVPTAMTGPMTKKRSSGILGGEIEMFV